MYGRIFRPFAIGPFTIIPEGESPATTDGLPLILGRKGAFGSGEHETTAACLEEMARLPSVAGSTVLDLGSGTGILAIAAGRLGASRIVALDNDPKAAVSCAENVRLKVPRLAKPTSKSRSRGGPALRWSTASSSPGSTTPAATYSTTA